MEEGGGAPTSHNALAEEGIVARVVNSDVRGPEPGTDEGFVRGHPRQWKEVRTDETCLQEHCRSRLRASPEAAGGVEVRELPICKNGVSGNGEWSADSELGLA